MRTHATPTPRTPVQELATVLLEEDVTELITKLRDKGTTYREIAKILSARTDGKIDVTINTVRSWYLAA